MIPPSWQKKMIESQLMSAAGQNLALAAGTVSQGTQPFSAQGQLGSEQANAQRELLARQRGAKAPVQYDPLLAGSALTPSAVPGTVSPYAGDPALMNITGSRSPMSLGAMYAAPAQPAGAGMMPAWLRGANVPKAPSPVPLGGAAGVPARPVGNGAPYSPDWASENLRAMPRSVVGARNLGDVMGAAWANTYGPSPAATAPKDPPYNPVAGALAVADRDRDLDLRRRAWDRSKDDRILAYARGDVPGAMRSSGTLAEAEGLPLDSDVRGDDILLGSSLNEGADLPGLLTRARTSGGRGGILSRMSGVAKAREAAAEAKAKADAALRERSMLEFGTDAPPAGGKQGAMTARAREVAGIRASARPLKDDPASEREDMVALSRAVASGADAAAISDIVGSMKTAKGVKEAFDKINEIVGEAVSPRAKRAESRARAARMELDALTRQIKDLSEARYAGTEPVVGEDEEYDALKAARDAAAKALGERIQDWTDATVESKAAVGVGTTGARPPETPDKGATIKSVEDGVEARFLAGEFGDPNSPEAVQKAEAEVARLSAQAK